MMRYFTLGIGFWLPGTIDARMAARAILMNAEEQVRKLSGEIDMSEVEEHSDMEKAEPHERQPGETEEAHRARLERMLQGPNSEN